MICDNDNNGNNNNDNNNNVNNDNDDDNDDMHNKMKMITDNNDKELCNANNYRKVYMIRHDT